MGAQRGIAHERDMNAAQVLIHLILIQAVVVLGESGAITDRLSKRHMVVVPVRPSSPGTGQPHTWSGEGGAHDIIGAVPFAGPAPKHHEENRSEEHTSEL